MTDNQRPEPVELEKTDPELTPPELTPSELTAPELTPPEQELRKRKIRSFVLREGRLTKGQEKAMTEQWPVMGLNISHSFLTWMQYLSAPHLEYWKLALAWVHPWLKWPR